MTGTAPAAGTPVGLRAAVTGLLFLLSRTRYGETRTRTGAELDIKRAELVVDVADVDRRSRELSGREANLRTPGTEGARHNRALPLVQPAAGITTPGPSAQSSDLVGNGPEVKT